MKKAKYNSGNWQDIKDNELNEGVRLLVDHVGLNGGSVGDMDLYVLIRNYLRRSIVRKDINQILRNHQSL